MKHCRPSNRTRQLLSTIMSAGDSRPFKMPETQ